MANNNIRPTLVASRRRRPMSEINVVPYIDVMLVLLIIFMVTAPLLTQGVSVDLPQAPSQPVESLDDEPLIVSVNADGSYYINLGADQEAATSLATVAEQTAKILRRKPDTMVLVRGDNSVPYGDVVRLMTALQGAGAPSVGLVTDPPDNL